MITHPLIRRCLYASVAALMLVLLAVSTFIQTTYAQQPTPAQQEEQEQEQPRRGEVENKLSRLAYVWWYFQCR